MTTVTDMKNAIGSALKKAIIWLGLAAIGIIAIPIVMLLGLIHLIWSSVDVVIGLLFNKTDS